MGSSYNSYSTRWRIGFTAEQYLTLNGKIFYAQYTDTNVADGSSVTIGIDIPAGYYPRGHASLTSDGGVTFEIREDVTYSGGNAIDAINMDRNSSNVDYMTFVSNPAVTDEGTVLFTGFYGSAGGGGWFGGSASPAMGNASPIAFKANTKYIIKVTNTSGSASKISVGFYFTEQVA